MRKYDSYKDSGIEWIGEIPSHWEKSRLCYLGEFTSSGIDKKINPEESLVKIINFTDIYKNKNHILDNNIDYMVVSAPENKIKQNLVKKGDLIFLPSSETYEDLGLSALVNEELENTSFSYHVINFRISPDMNHEFKKYLTNNNFVLNQFAREGQGTTRKIIGRNVFRNIKVAIPPLEEQTAIAYFLDQKTTQIDDLIAKKARLIKLLDEERTAIINQAVTKGLDPSVPMKDSGIEWLGEIPEHWELKRMRYLCDITTGGRDTENREDDGLYPFYVRSQTVERISSYSYDGEAILTAGDGVGVCKVWHYVNEKFDFHQRVYMMCNFQQVLGKYLFYYLKENFGKEVMKLSAKSTVDSLRRPMFQNFLVCFGSIEEQKQIVLKIEMEENRIQTIIRKTQQEIELLNEYKTALISEVVTGKVDVRNWQPMNKN
jgi:type I restriction enzyme S subunit